MTTPDFISIKEFCERTSMADSTVRQKIRAGVIPAIMIGGRVRIPMSYVDDLLQQAYSPKAPRRRARKVAKR